MKLVSIDTPQSERELALWMEQTMVSPNFGEWLAELSAVQSVEPTHQTAFDFNVFINDRLSQIADYGLMCLSRTQMCELLCHPQQLLELQKLVFVHESEYWSKLLQRQESTSESERERTNIALYLGPEAVVLARQGAGSIQTKPTYGASIKRVAITLASIAILILAGYWVAGYLQHQRAVSAEWNWQTQMNSMPISTPKEYFQTLAQQADQWYRVRPTNIDQLKTRIQKLHDNLHELVNDANAAIKEGDRKWLKQVGTQWLAKCDAVTKAENFEDALREADDLCAQMIDALQRRADSFNR